MRRFMKNKKGFTLVELLIVVVILGILAAVAIPRFVATKDGAQTEACRSNQSAMQSIVEEVLFNETVAVAGVTIDQVAAHFPNGLPVCPTEGVYSMSLAGTALVPSTNKVACSIAAHAL